MNWLMPRSLTETKYITKGYSQFLISPKGGCYTHCYAPLPVGIRLLITMIPPAFPDNKINVTGTIVREEPCHNEGYYLAVHFNEYHEGSKANMDKFIEYLTPKAEYTVGKSEN